MDYHRIDDSHFISLITWLPKVVVFEIVEYGYAKCIDCKYYVLKEFECNNCKTIRCHYHAWLNTAKLECHTCFSKEKLIEHKYQNNVNDIDILCIIPNCKLGAVYGYKDTVYYCNKHSKKKHKIIEYNVCTEHHCFFLTNMLIENTLCYVCKIHQKSNNKYEYDYITYVKL